MYLADVYYFGAKQDFLFRAVRCVPGKNPDAIRKLVQENPDTDLLGTKPSYATVISKEFNPVMVVFK